jgi:ubiquinone/menaquinone biosynthesis C-methylase UbiE
MTMAETKKTGWQVVGKAPVAWELFLIPSCVDQWTENLVTRAGLRPGERVLDVACGTGLVARKALARVRWDGTVTGIDINATQLEVAREAAQFVHPPIEFIEGDAQKLPFPDGSFDAVFCQHGLQYFPDRLVALREMHRVLAPNGRLTFLVWRHRDYHDVWSMLADAFDRHVGQGCGDPMRSIFQLHDGDFIRGLVKDAGFSRVKLEIKCDSARFPSVREFVRFQSSVLPRPNPAHDPTSAIDPIAEDLAPKLAHYVDDFGFVFPCQGWIVDARR